MMELIDDLGAGVIGDITTPAERGGLIGVFGGSMLQLPSNKAKPV
jgi:hypothetical protein